MHIYMVRDLLEFSQSDTEQLSARVTSFDLIGLQCRRECESALWLCDVTYKYSLFFRALTKGSHSAVTSLIFNPMGQDQVASQNTSQYILQWPPPIRPLRPRYSVILL